MGHAVGSMHRDTVDVYERQAGEYERRRPPRYRDQAVALAGHCLPGLAVADLGCGPGRYGPDLGPVVVGLDAARAMLDRSRAHSVPVQADLEALPFRDRSLGGAWARNSYVHVARDRLPLALARLHWSLAVGAPVALSFITGEGEGPYPDDDLPGRRFSLWPPEDLGAVLVGAGFDVDDVSVSGDRAWFTGRRARTLPDTVGPGMRLLVCGLNPSVVAADAGFGYAGATNRYWSAAVAAGLVRRPRDPLRALVDDGVGMTDLVKRATPAAAGLDRAEYVTGAERVRRLVGWLRPCVVLFVGLAGWRATVDSKATTGVQPKRFGGAPAYVMPSTSGLNARTTLAELVAHMRSAAALVTS